MSQIDVARTDYASRLSLKLKSKKKNLKNPFSLDVMHVTDEYRASLSENKQFVLLIPNDKSYFTEK